jgi:hypothetical protein
MSVKVDVLRRERDIQGLPAIVMSINHYFYCLITVFVDID